MLAVLLAAAILFTGINPFSMEVRAETGTASELSENGAGEAYLNAPEVDGKTDGPDYEVTYDTVYFGEYPQSEVLTNKMAREEAGAADWFLYITSEVVVDDGLYGKLEAAEYDEAEETVFEDVRYRRIASGETSSGAEWRYFRYDPIRWRVLCVHGIEYTDRTTDCALLLSDQVLDILPFDEKGEGLWEDSSLRTWLNESFVHTAFTDDEYWNDIAIVEAEASDGSFEAYGDEKNSADDVFVLSGSELFGEEAEEYGFILSRDNTWTGSCEDIARQARATRFALAAEFNDRETGETETDSALISWWTRSSISDTEAGIVDYPGEGGSAAKDMTGIGIRPALWMDLESASEDYVYEGRLRITPGGYEVIRHQDGNGEEEVKEKEEKKEEEKQQPDKAGTDIEKTGKYSDAMLYMTAELLLKGVVGDSFQNINNTVTEHLEPVDMEESLPGRWLVYAQTDLENPANERYNYDAPEPYYPMFALHMVAEVSKEDTGFCMTPGRLEMLDCDTGEISTEEINETLTGDIVRDSGESDDGEEFILFDGSVQIKILGIAALQDRLYALGTLTYSSGESLVLCMVREDGAGVSSDGNGREEKENGGKEEPDHLGEKHALDDYPILWTSFNTAVVKNGPSKPTVFTVEEGESWQVYSLMTYHWNKAEGKEPGTITLLKDGEIMAEWQTVGMDGMYNVADANWIAYTDIVLEPGEYEVIDSDPETWSCNAGSDNTGFAELRGEILEGSGASGKEPADGDRDAYRDSFEDAEGLYTYLLQSMTYDDGIYGPSGICEAVHIRFDEKAGVMEIYEFGLFDEPDMILPWDSDIKAPKGEYDDGDYHIRADMDAIADGAFAGPVEMPDMGLCGYFRLDPLIPLEKGQWEYDPDFEGFQWIDVAKFEEIKDPQLRERFAPENAENENIWLVNTTGETTLWDWAVYMEGYSRVNDMLIEEAGKYADENGYSMEGWKPHKRMTEQK